MIRTETTIVIIFCGIQFAQYCVEEISSVTIIYGG